MASIGASSGLTGLSVTAAQQRARGESQGKGAIAVPAGSFACAQRAHLAAMQPCSLITGQLIAQLTPSLRRTARRAVRREHDAEDALQDMWLSALRSASHYRGQSSLTAWLRRILKRRLVDQYRADRPRELLVEEQVAASGCSADVALEFADMSRSIGAALASLTPLERSVVGLCELQERDRLQVAAELDITPVYLRVVLHRARRKLSSRLEPPCSRL